MSTKQLLALCVCNFVVYAVGSALVGLMPIYLTRLGADATLTGVFLSAAYLLLAASTLLSGRISDRIQQRRSLLIAAGILGMPLLWLMSTTTSVTALMILMASLFFMSGVINTMVNVIGGLFSEEGERERTFGLVVLGAGFGMLFGTLVSGPIVDRWGFPTLFALMAVFNVIIPIAGLVVPDKRVIHAARALPAPGPRSILSNRIFLFLFVSGILAQIANSTLVLARPLIMDALHFDTTAISTTAAIGALIALPVPPLIGRLATRIGRKPVVIACILTTTVGLILLSVAGDYWHFWLVSGMQAILAADLIVESALVTDLFPPESLGTALSLLNSTPWIGFVIGLAVGGAAINAFHVAPTLGIGVVLTVIALALLVPISMRSKPVTQAETA